jgi:hypothetical protein
VNRKKRNNLVNIVAALAFLAIFAFAAPASAQSEPPFCEHWGSLPEGAWVYRGPGYGYGTWGVLGLGAKVGIVAQEGDWLLISYDFPMWIHRSVVHEDGCNIPPNHIYSWGIAYPEDTNLVRIGSLIPDFWEKQIPYGIKVRWEHDPNRWGEVWYTWHPNVFVPNPVGGEYTIKIEIAGPRGDWRNYRSRAVYSPEWELVRMDQEFSPRMRWFPEERNPGSYRWDGQYWFSEWMWYWD